MPREIVDLSDDLEDDEDDEDISLLGDPMDDDLEALFEKEGNKEVDEKHKFDDKNIEKEDHVIEEATMALEDLAESAWEEGMDLRINDDDSSLQKAVADAMDMDDTIKQDDTKPLSRDMGPKYSSVRRLMMQKLSTQETGDLDKTTMHGTDEEENTKESAVQAANEQHPSDEKDSCNQVKYSKNPPQHEDHDTDEDEYFQLTPIANPQIKVNLTIPTPTNKITTKKLSIKWKSKTPKTDPTDKLKVDAPTSPNSITIIDKFKPFRYSSYDVEQWDANIDYFDEVESPNPNVLGLFASFSKANRLKEETPLEERDEDLIEPEEYAIKETETKTNEVEQKKQLQAQGIKEMEVVDREEEKAKEMLQNLLNEVWQKDTEEFQKRVKERQETMVTKQQMQRGQLGTTQEKRMEAFKTKVKQRVQMIKQKMNTEKSQALQMHEQECQRQMQLCSTPMERQNVQQRLAQQWNHVTLKQFEARLEDELTKLRQQEQAEHAKLQQRFTEQTNMLSQHHNMRQEELLIECTEEKNRIHAQRAQQMQYHQRLLEERANDRRSDIRKKYNLSGVMNSDTDQQDGKVPSIKDDLGKNGAASVERVSYDLYNFTSPSAIRQKLRKTVTSGLPIQLAVDLYNEGIVVHYRSSDTSHQQISENPVTDLVDNHPLSASFAKSADEKPKSADSKRDFPNIVAADVVVATTSSEDKTQAHLSQISQSTGKWASGSGGGRSEFIPWSVRSRQLLESVLCGEVPRGFAASMIDSEGKGLLQAGQIKCMVTDMRVSDEVASSQRALAMRNIDMRKWKARHTDLENKAAEFQNKLAEKEKMLARCLQEEKECVLRVKKASKEVEIARRLRQEIQLKTRPFLRQGNYFHTLSNHLDNCILPCLNLFHRWIPWSESKRSRAIISTPGCI